jgi:hypothetical protein
MQRHVLARLGSILVLLVLFPRIALAQSAIAGVVKDTTGAVLPGVTVEAASPALIERTRTAVTDQQGQYKIIDLRPGVYLVTFSLTGFSIVKRDQIELTANFTASVNAELKVGALEETVIVSGQASAVDVQSTQRRDVLTREVLDVLPTGRNYQTIGNVLPGLSMGRFDVGGSTTMQQGNLMTAGSLSADMVTEIDGMSVNSSLTPGNVSVYHNDGAYQEYVYQVSGGTAESQTGGVRMNMIPKEGSNQFKGDGIALFTNGNFQATNVTPELRARGVTAPAKLDKNWDYNGGVGFPIRKDRVWWFTSFRNWGYNNFAPNAFYADGRQGVDDNLIQAYTNRATVQINSWNKFTAMYDKLPKFRGHRNIETGTVDPNAAVVQKTPLAYNGQAKWTSTVSNKLLVEAGYSTNYYNYSLHYEPEVAGPSAAKPYGDISHFDIITNRLSGAAQMDFRDWFMKRNLVGSVSYVTGSHAFKTGIQYGWGWINSWRDANGSMVQRYRNGAPDSITRWSAPTLSESDLDRDIGLYVQDSWTIRRLTLNPGIRFEFFRGSVPAQSIGAGRFVPDRSFAPIPDLPNWKNTVPRFGAAYDVFGNGKTAIKASFGKYMQQDATNFPAKYNPMVLTSDIVTWTDLNHDDIAQDNELGRATNNTLGIRRNINPDPALERSYQRVYNVGVQHELVPRVSLSANYYRREYHNLVYTTNLAVPVSAYTLVTIPDPRGNGQTLPVYNLLPAYLGLVDELDTTSPNNKRTYNGFDLLINGRPRVGATIGGGLAIGRTVSRICDVEDPNALRFCDETQYRIPWSTTVKINGSYPLPYGFRLSGVFQSADNFGPAAPANTPPANPDSHDRKVNYIVNRTIVPGLTQTQVNVLLNAPGSDYLERVNQLDLSVARIIRARRSIVLTPQVDVFNVFNANMVLTEVSTFGSSLGNPNTILGPRLIRFQMKIAF